MSKDVQSFVSTCPAYVLEKGRISGYITSVSWICRSVCSDWYLVQCKAGKEYFAITMLKKIMELPVYLPESQTYVHGELRQIPFFPSYFFIQADLQKISRRVINNSPGILHIVGFDEDLQPVPHAVVKMIAERLEELLAALS